jgi:hypothetical protein
MRKSGWAVCIALFALGLGSISACRCEELTAPVCKPGTEHGFVESVKGRWIDTAHLRKPKNELQAFSVFCDDSKLTPVDTASPDDFLKLRYLDGVSKTVTCSSPVQCSQPITFPAPQPALSGFSQVLKALINFGAPPPAEVISRGATLHDAVLEIKAGQIILGPAVRFADPDTYIVRLCRLNLNDTSICTTGQFEQKTDIDGQDTKPISAPNLMPGLYQLELRDPSRPEEKSNSAWVLLCDEKNFSRINAKYQSDIDSASKWENPMPASDFSRLIRLYLIGLAGQL